MANIGTLTIEMAANIARLQSDMNQAKQVVNDSMKSITEAVDLAKKAMVAFAGVATVDAFANMVRGNIEAAAAMGKLATQAGVTTEALSKLASAGKLSGTSADTIAAAMNKMTKAVSGTEEDAKGAGAALSALGISFADFDKMNADERMVAVAKAMDKFKDGTGKSAAAMALMGKSGAEMLAYLKDLAVVGELQAKVTTEQSKQAKDFEQNLKRVTATSDAWKKELSMGMLPALDEASKAYLAVMNGAGGFRDEIIRLSKDGSIAEWTRNAITALTYLMDTFEGVWRVAKAIGVGMGAQWAAMAAAATGNFSGAAGIIKDAWGDIGDIFSAQTMGSKFRDRMEELKGLKAAAEAAKPSLKDDFNRKDDSNKDMERQAALINELAGLTKSFTKDWGDLDAMYKRGALSVEQLTKAQAVLLEKQPAIKAAHDADEKEIERVEKANLAAAEAHLKYVQSLEKGLEKMQADVTAQQEQNDRLGLSKEAIAALDAAKLESQAVALEVMATKRLERDFDEYQYDLYIKQAKALRDLGAAKQAGAIKAADIEAFNALWHSVDKTAHDVFVNIFQGGQDAFTKLRDVLKATLLDLLYQMTVRKWVFDITASVSGAGGSAVSAAAQGLSGGSSMLSAAAQGLSGGSSMFGGLGGLGAFGGAASSGFSLGGAGFMPGIEMMTNATGMSSFMAGAGQAVGSALAAAGPYVLAAVALKALTDYKITPDGNGLTATLGAGGLTTGQVGTFQQFQQSSSGILSGGNTTNRSWGVADAGTTAYIDESAKAITAANRAYGDALGLSSTALDAYTASIEVNTTGMDAAAAKAAIDAALTKFAADQASAAYGSAVDAYKQGSETTSQTLARLGESLMAVNSWSALFGTTLQEVSVVGAASAAALVAAFGGLQKMNSALSSYYQNYYTQAERDANTYLQIQSDLAKQGIDISVDDLKNATKEGVRAWVEVAKSLYDAGIFTADQLAAALNAANSIAPILGRNGSSQEAQDAAYEQARHDWAVLHPWEDAAGSYLNRDGSVTQGPLYVGGGGGAGGASVGAGTGAGAGGWQDTIKSWLAKLDSTNNGVVDVLRQTQTAWASYSTQLALARGGDATAQSSITSYADTYITALKATSKTMVEEQIAIARIKEQMGGLIDDKTPAQKIVDAITASGDGIVSVLYEISGSGGGGAGGGGLTVGRNAQQQGASSDVVEAINGLADRLDKIEVNTAASALSNHSAAQTLDQAAGGGRPLTTLAVA